MTRISSVRTTIVTLAALGLLAAEASAGTITVHTPTTPPKITVHPPSPQWGVGRGITATEPPDPCRSGCATAPYGIGSHEKFNKTPTPFSAGGTGTQ